MMTIITIIAIVDMFADYLFVIVWNLMRQHENMKNCAEQSQRNSIRFNCNSIIGADFVISIKVEWLIPG